MPEKHPKTTDSLMRYLRDKKELQCSIINEIVWII